MSLIEYTFCYSDLYDEMNLRLPRGIPDDVPACTASWDLLWISASCIGLLVILSYSSATVPRKSARICRIERSSFIDDKLASAEWEFVE